jgi:Protein of unknown function (DUF3616)
MPSISQLGTVNFIGKILHNEDISAIDVSKKFLVIGSDEGNQVQVLGREGENYKVINEIALNKNAVEIDIEGIACEGNTVYVVGSHSCKSNKNNKEAKIDPDRDRLFRFSLDDYGKKQALEETSLRDFLDSQEVLKDYRHIPSQKNGVDIEGIAVRKEQLYIGFRSPVLPGNWVPVLKCRFANPIAEAKLVYVQLGGLGVRDITRVEKGFLILAGPREGSSGSYQVYFWDGKDCQSRKSGRIGQIEHLGEIPTPKDGKAEGLVMLEESPSDYEVLIIYDHLKNGAPTRLRIEK